MSEILHVMEGRTAMNFETIKTKIEEASCLRTSMLHR
ncbi:hypothetical protein ACVJBD_002242 [Rhizobium mongolense]